MANEAVLLVELEPPVPMVVGDATALEKGAVLQLNDGMVVTGTSGDNQVVAGIAAQEKIANDGRVSTAVHLRGIFLMTVDAGDVATVGKQCVIRAANKVGVYDTLDNELGLVIGKFLETAVAGETVKVLVNV